jgi:hypothetical protein
LLGFTALLWNSQQPVLSVQSFDYVWEKTGGATLSPDKSRVIIASEDSAKKYIRNAFAVALRQRWNLEMPEASLSVKPLGIVFIYPKIQYQA